MSEKPGRHCFVVATVTVLLELVTVLMVAWAFDFKTFATAVARLLASLTLLPNPVTVIDAPLTSSFDRVDKWLRAADDSAALPALKVTVNVRGRDGRAMETAVGDAEIDEYVPSEALVAVTRQVPALVAESEVPETAQPLAEPFVTL
jgi:hypothetical protein